MCGTVVEDRATQYRRRTGKCFPKTLDCNASGRDNDAKFIGQVYDVNALCRRVRSCHLTAEGMIREPFAHYVTLRS